ncbi:MAG TPA: MmcQ/YjbR family DNA-binding protein [Chitinophagaceae bacterium]
MVSVVIARQVALSMPEAQEKSHFDIPDFRVKNKIFASIHTDKNYMMVKLSAVDQSVFCSYDKEVIFPVPGGWGRKGATFINLEKVKKAMLRDAVQTAWKTVAPVSLRKRYFPE